MDAEPLKAAVQSQVLLTTLAEITSSRTADADQGAAAECCVICLEELSEPSSAQPCGHSNFDFICLTSWLAVDPKCPLCKAPVLRVRYTDSAGPQTYTVPAKEPASTSSSTSSIPRSAQTTFQHYFLNRNNYQRRRRVAHNPTTPTSSPSAALLRRRQIYAQNLYSLHVGANPLSRYRSGPTPADFASDPDLVSRARTFIRRELQVFSFLSDPGASIPSSSSTSTSASTSRSGVESAAAASRRAANNAEFLLEYTVAILKTVDMQGATGQAESMLADFLGRDAARLFLHELRAWLRSPCLSLEAWDRGVQYPDPPPQHRHRDDKRKRGREDNAAVVEGVEAPGGTEERGIARMETDVKRRRRRGKGDYWRPGHGREDRGRSRRGDGARVEAGG
jgi:hypothetical protein